MTNPALILSAVMAARGEGNSSPTRLNKYIACRAKILYFSFLVMPISIIL